MDAYRERTVLGLIEHVPHRPRLVIAPLSETTCLREFSPIETKAVEPLTAKMVVDVLDVVSVGDDVPGTVGFATLLEREQGKPASLRPNADDPFLLLYTSGTTSSPKAVSVSFNHYLSNARLCAAEYGLRPDDRILCLDARTGQTLWQSEGRLGGSSGARRRRFASVCRGMPWRRGRRGRCRGRRGRRASCLRHRGCTAQLVELARELSAAEPERLDDVFRRGMALNVAAAVGVEDLSVGCSWVQAELRSVTGSH